jgi:hypothetical protein
MNDLLESFWFEGAKSRQYCIIGVGRYTSASVEVVGPPWGTIFFFCAPPPPPQKKSVFFGKTLLGLFHFGGGGGGGGGVETFLRGITIPTFFRGITIPHFRGGMVKNQIME